MWQASETVMEQRGFSSGRSGMAAAEDMQRVLRHRPLVTAPIDDRAGLSVLLSFAVVWLILG